MLNYIIINTNEVEYSGCDYSIIYNINSKMLQEIVSGIPTYDYEINTKEDLENAKLSIELGIENEQTETEIENFFNILDKNYI